jgi:hypothetical protein
VLLFVYLKRIRHQFYIMHKQNTDYIHRKMLYNIRTCFRNTKIIKTIHTEFSNIKNFNPESQYIKYDIPNSYIPSENRPNPIHQ